MTQNRYMPYGYQIENGSVTVNQEEADAICRIYMAYAKGLSYKKIAEDLTMDGVRYMPTKPAWNKNMIARILQNDSYLGTEKFPQIIDEYLKDAVRQAQKPYTLTESEEVKTLKPLFICELCGSPVKRRIKTNGEERWYCQEDHTHIATSLTDGILLNSITSLQKILIRNPKMGEKNVPGENLRTLESMRLQNEIQRLLEKTEIDDKEIQSKILELATNRYSECGSENIHDKPLIHTIEQIKDELNATLLSKILSEIRVAKNGADALILINGNQVRKE